MPNSFTAALLANNRLKRPSFYFFVIRYRNCNSGVSHHFLHYNVTAFLTNSGEPFFQENGTNLFT